MICTWERAPQAGAPESPAILAYRCYETVLPRTKGGVMPYTQRLPYTQVMLERRRAAGRDVPEWWSCETGELR